MTRIEDMEALEVKALEEGKEMVGVIEKMVSIYGVSEFKGWLSIKPSIEKVFTEGGVIGLAFYGTILYGTFASYIHGLVDAGYFTMEKLKEIEERIEKMQEEDAGFFTKEKLKGVRENLKKMKEEALNGNRRKSNNNRRTRV